MMLVITAGIIVIAITGLSIEGKLRKVIDQNKEIINLLNNK
ncbi:hypothetical protein [Cytobacillus gottheilii]|nr:hypothetical protein [Cytobacillus gottheilii]